MCCYIDLIESILDQWEILKHFRHSGCILIREKNIQILICNFISFWTGLGATTVTLGSDLPFFKTVYAYWPIVERFRLLCCKFMHFLAYQAKIVWWWTKIHKCNICPSDSSGIKDFPSMGLCQNPGNPDFSERDYLKWFQNFYRKGLGSLGNTFVRS